MASGNGRVATVARQMGRLFEEGTLSGLNEGQLLDRFLERRDESAFAVLVERHSSLVMGVCRRVLGDAHDAEDAFQATFLLLVRKAGSIRHQKLLGGWLHRVAYRVATRAGQSASRRRSVEKVDSETAANVAAPEGPSGDLTRVLHEELARLSDNDRAVVVMCDLEGLSHSEAAARLNWPVGTVKGRLFRARERLRGRLVRRGLTLSAGIVASTLASEAKAGVSRALVASTVQAAAQVAGGQAVSGAASASAVALAGGVARTMMVSKMKIIASLFLAGGILAAGAGAVLVPGDGKVEREAAASAKAPERSDLARLLVGTWKPREGLVRTNENPPGNPLPANAMRDSFTFKADGTYDHGVKGGYRVDIARNPAQIDFLGDDQETTEEGIFRISDDGQTLTLYLGSPEGRPESFEAVVQTPRIHMVLDRQAEVEETDQERIARLIVGSWDMREMEIRRPDADGKPVTIHRPQGKGSPSAEPSFTFRADGTYLAGSQDAKGYYRVDASRSPLVIDLFDKEPPNGSKPGLYGIFQVSDDGQTLTLYTSNGERPANFEETGPDERIFAVLDRRVEKPEAEKGKSEELARRLVGTWEFREGEVRRAKEEGEPRRFEIDSNNVEPRIEPCTFRADGTCHMDDTEGRFEVDASQNPAAIDFFLKSPGEPVVKSFGILELSDDDQALTLYYSEEKRPASFEETGDEQRVLLRMVRRAEENEQEPIVGFWKVEEERQGGVKVDAGLGTVSGILFREDGTYDYAVRVIALNDEQRPLPARFVLEDRNEVGRNTYTVDPLARPHKQIELRTGGLTLPGLYRMNAGNDELWIALGKPNGSRPGDFPPKESVGSYYRLVRGDAETEILDTKLERVSEVENSEIPVLGAWKVLYIERDGKVAWSSRGAGSPIRFRFQGDGDYAIDEAVRSKLLEQIPHAGRFEIGPGLTPASLALETSDARVSGIYRLDDETMTYCVLDTTASNPTSLEDFTTRPGDGHIAFVMERTEDDPDQAPEPTNELVGTWRMVEKIESGKVIPEVEVGSEEFVILPDRILTDGRAITAQRYKIDSETHPKQITLFELDDSKTVIGKGI